jgi:hypothetical protein
VIEVNICNQGSLYSLPDGPESIGRIHTGYRYSDNIRTRAGQVIYLGHSRFNVTGIGIGHALHRNRCITTYGNIAHHNLPGHPAFNIRSLPHVLLSVANDQLGGIV